MHFPLFMLIFCSLLGILVVLYFLNFRHRAYYMGSERLRNALARTVSGGEEDDREGSEERELSREDLWGGLLQLESRLRISITLTSAALVILLIPGILLTVTSTLPDLVMVLSALGVLLVAALICEFILRDILHFLHAQMEGETNGG